MHTSPPTAAVRFIRIWALARAACAAWDSGRAASASRRPGCAAISLSRPRPAASAGLPASPAASTQCSWQILEAVSRTPAKMCGHRTVSATPGCEYKSDSQPCKPIIQQYDPSYPPSLVASCIRQWQDCHSAGCCDHTRQSLLKPGGVVTERDETHLYSCAKKIMRWHSRTSTPAFASSRRYA